MVIVPQKHNSRFLEGKIEAYKNEGYSSEEAEKKAKEWVAVPGTSEHQLGLAVDINADKSQSTSEEVYEWLSKMRISMDLYNDTRRIKRILPIQFTNLALSVCRNDAAFEIFSQNICLEEYIETLE